MDTAQLTLAPVKVSWKFTDHVNGLGQLVLEQRPYQDWEHRVDGCGVTDNAGTEIYTHYGYNSLGQQVRVSVPESQARSVYDDAVAAETTRWTGKSYSRTDFDAIGRPLQSYSPNGEMTYHGYAGHNHATFQQTRDGGYDKTVRWESIDLYGQLEYIRTYYWGLANSVWGWQQDSQVTLTHDASGNLTKVTRTASGSTTTLSTMSYDLGGRKLNMNDADLGNWQYSYDRLSNLTRQTDARGWSTCLHCDGLQRLVSKNLQLNNTTCPSAPTYQISYAYDQGHSTTNRSKGQLTNIGYLDGRWVKWLTYDEKGLIAQESVSIGANSYTTQYDYDSYMRPITTTYPDGEVITTTYPDGEVITTTYNSMGLPAKLSSSLGGDLVDGHTPIGQITDAVNYDVAGRLTSMRFPLGNNVWRTQSYFGWTGSTADSNGRLSSIKVSNAGTGGAYSNSGNLLNLSYSYDSFSNIDQLVERYNSSTTVTNTFSYDAQNRLLTAYGKQYNYDPVGRMLKYEATSNNQSFNDNFPINAIKNTGYLYDANGNLTQRPTGTITQTLVWDSENHLSQVKNGSTVLESYTYDTDGNRVKKTVGSTSFYYPFAHYEISGTTTIKYYFFGGQRIAMKVGSTLTYLHGDHLGSTVLATTNAGAWQSQDKYYAYGKDREPASNVPTDHKFTGQKLDGSGLMYYGARYYDPQIGVFISPDTIVPSPGAAMSYNRYAYANLNPLNSVDPSGHKPMLTASIGQAVIPHKKQPPVIFTGLPFVVPSGPNVILMNHFGPTNFSEANAQTNLYDGTSGLHGGTDFMMPFGTPIISATTGVVTAINSHDADPNVVVTVVAANGETYNVVYGHVNANDAIKIGSSIEPNTLIGTVADYGNDNDQPGGTGNDHLHLGVVNGATTAYNPLYFFPPTTFDYDSHIKVQAGFGESRVEPLMYQYDYGYGNWWDGDDVGALNIDNEAVNHNQ